MLLPTLPTASADIFLVLEFIPRIVYIIWILHGYERARQHAMYLHIHNASCLQSKYMVQAIIEL